jgi:hypothetical protein
VTVTTPASVPSDVEPTRLDDLIADARVVQRLLDVHETPTVAFPEQRSLRIPEPAVALVAGLDSYGD